MSSEGSHKLNYSYKNLRRIWDELEPVWRDQVRRDFEQHYIHPLGNQVNACVRGMNEIFDIIQKARRDCS